MEVLPRWRCASVAFRGYLEPVSWDDVGVVREVLEEGINLDPRLESTWERASEWLAPDFEQCWDDPSKRDVLMQIARLVEHDPIHSPHMVAVARKLA